MQQLADQSAADLVALGDQRLRQLRQALAGPAQRRHRIAACIRLWKDRHTPPPEQIDDELAESPDLGPAFEFQPRDGALCPGLDRVHVLAYPATLSLGVITGDIPAISEGALQLADALAGLLYAEDVEHHYARMEAYAEPEIFGDEWVAEPLPRAPG